LRFAHGAQTLCMYVEALTGSTTKDLEHVNRSHKKEVKTNSRRINGE
jgi:hypothetical protein